MEIRHQHDSRREGEPPGHESGEHRRRRFLLPPGLPQAPGRADGLCIAARGCRAKARETQASTSRHRLRRLRGNDTRRGPGSTARPRVRISSQDGCTLRLEQFGGLTCVKTAPERPGPGRGDRHYSIDWSPTCSDCPAGEVMRVACGDTLGATSVGGGSFASRGLAVGGEAALTAAHRPSANASCRPRRLCSVSSRARLSLPAALSPRAAGAGSICGNSRNCCTTASTNCRRACRRRSRQRGPRKKSFRRGRHS